MRVFLLLAVFLGLVCAPGRAEQIHVAILEFSGDIDPGVLDDGLEGIDLTRCRVGERLEAAKNDDVRNGRATFLYRGPLLKGASISSATAVETGSTEVTYTVQGGQAQVEVVLTETSSAILRKTRRISLSGVGQVGSVPGVLAVRQSSATIVSSDRAQRTKMTTKGSTRLLVVQLSR